MTKAFCYGLRPRKNHPEAQPMDGLLFTTNGIRVSGKEYHKLLYYDAPLTLWETKYYELDFLGEVVLKDGVNKE